MWPIGGALAVPLLGKLVENHALLNCIYDGYTSKTAYTFNVSGYFLPCWSEAYAMSAPAVVELHQPSVGRAVDCPFETVIVQNGHIIVAAVQPFRDNPISYAHRNS